MRGVFHVISRILSPQAVDGHIPGTLVTEAPRAVLPSQRLVTTLHTRKDLAVSPHTLPYGFAPVKSAYASRAKGSYFTGRLVSFETKRLCSHLSPYTGGRVLPATWLRQLTLPGVSGLSSPRTTIVTRGDHRRLKTIRYKHRYCKSSTAPAGMNPEGSVRRCPIERPSVLAEKALSSSTYRAGSRGAKTVGYVSGATFSSM